MPGTWEKPCTTRWALYRTTFPAASFFAWKTHFEPTMFAFSGASASSHVPAVFNVANSSCIAFSHRCQSGHFFASARLCGSNASVSPISAANAYSSTQSACKGNCDPGGTSGDGAERNAVLAGDPKCLVYYVSKLNKK